MAEDVQSKAVEPGAPIPKDQIDPELVKLGRSKPKIGVVTAAGIVFLCGFFLWKLQPDRRFAGEAEEARKVTVADVARGAVGPDAHVTVDAEPLMAHAIRSATKAGAIGMRVVPARGSAEKLWLVLPGDGWGDPNTAGYTGRLRPLADLPIAASIEEHLAAHPRPLFAAASAVRGAFGTNKVTTVAGDTITVRDGDRVGFDVVDAGSAIVLCAYNEHHADAAACSKALGDAGITTTGAPVQGNQQARFIVSMADAVATTRTKLETAKLWGTQVEPITQHYETTWGKLKGSAPAGFTVDAVTVPDAQLDLIGLYVVRSIPDGAVALLSGENPKDYWYVLPVTILVGLIGLLFLWALVRGIKRDLLPTSATPA